MSGKQVAKALGPVIALVILLVWAAIGTSGGDDGTEKAVTAVSADERYVYANANLRSGPGTEYSITGQASAGEKILIEAVVGDWARLRGNRGYISQTLLRDHPMAPAFDEVRTKMQGATDAQFNQYRRQLVGFGVEWTGWIDEVNEKALGGYEVWIDMDPPGSWSVQDVTFDVSPELALKLQKDQRIRFTGTIENILNVLETTHVQLTGVRVIE